MKTSLKEKDPGFEITLIRSYGELWSRDLVGWGENSMLGDRRHYKQTVRNLEPKVKGCNVWEQRGVYALYQDFSLVYVGKAISGGGLGRRLHEQATKSRFHRQWDAFSWFSIDGFDPAGKREAYKPAWATEEVIADTLELVTILIANPPLNRARGKFKGAEKISQHEPKKDTRSDTEVIDQMSKLLDSLAK